MKKSEILLLFILFAANSILSQGVKIKPNTCFYIQSGTTASISSGNLVLESDETADASLIDKGTLNYGAKGHAVVQRYLTNGHWHLIAAPVSNAIAGLFTGDYLQMFSESTNGWTDITSVAYELNIMQGYALWSTAGVATTEIYEGITNTGDFDFSFTFSDPDNGFNLIGNPYPSQIDWDQVTIPDHMCGAFWVFDPSLGEHGGYRHYVKGGGEANTTSQYIPSGQGFFVRAADDAGTLNFGNDIRCHGNQEFLKTENEQPMLVLKVKGNGNIMQKAIRFVEGANRDFDRLLDVDLMTGHSNDLPHLYSIINQHELVVNSLPAFVGDEKVPVSFMAGKDGEYEIFASGLNSFSDEVQIFLEDIIAGTVTNLRNHPFYAFAYDTSQTYEFVVRFKASAGIEESENVIPQWVKIYVAEGQLHVDFAVWYASLRQLGADLLVSDISGRILFTKKIHAVNNTYQIPAGCRICLVRIISGDYIMSGKVISHF